MGGYSLLRDSIFGDEIKKKIISQSKGSLCLIKAGIIR
jgi:hypothetical protein